MHAKLTPMFIYAVACFLLMIPSPVIGQVSDGISSGAPVQLKKLGFCIGKWEVRPQSAGATSPPVARMHAYWTLDGYAILADYRGLDRKGSVAVRGTNFRTYHPGSKKFHMRWMVAGKPDHTLISGNFENGDLVTTGKGKDQWGDFIERYRFYDIEEDSYKFRLEKSYDKGKTWQLHALNRYDRVG